MNARFASPGMPPAFRTGDDRFKNSGERYGQVELQLVRRMFGSGSLIASHTFRGSPLRDPWLEGTVLARFVQDAYSSRTPLREVWLTLGDFRVDSMDARAFMQRREAANQKKEGSAAKIADKFECEGQRFRLGAELVDFLKAKLEKEGVTLE